MVGIAWVATYVCIEGHGRRAWVPGLWKGTVGVAWVAVCAEWDGWRVWVSVCGGGWLESLGSSVEGDGWRVWVVVCVGG
jgi:hypothetical protein